MSNSTNLVKNMLYTSHDVLSNKILIATAMPPISSASDFYVYYM